MDDIKSARPAFSKSPVKVWLTRIWPSQIAPLVNFPFIEDLPRSCSAPSYKSETSPCIQSWAKLYTQDFSPYYKSSWIKSDFTALTITDSDSFQLYVCVHVCVYLIYFLKIISTNFSEQSFWETHNMKSKLIHSIISSENFNWSIQMIDVRWFIQMLHKSCNFWSKVHHLK